MNNNDISLILQVEITSASISVFQVFYSGNSKDLESSLRDLGVSRSAVKRRAMEEEANWKKNVRTKLPGLLWGPLT